MLEILILSVIQGVTEFIPISSSSHLILISSYLDFENQNLSIDVSLHIGSFFAVLFYFRNDVLNFLKNKDLFFKIFFSSIPVMCAGYILIEFDLIHFLRNLEIIGWTTIIFGVLLFLSDKSKRKNKIDKDFNYKSAILIGFFQALSLIPGVSRSGITLTAGRFLEFKRVEAAKISFLLSIPTLTAASLFNIQNLIVEKNFSISLLNLLGVFLSFFFFLHNN